MTIAHPSCPVCGQTIAEDNTVLVDFSGGLVVRGHDVATLSRTEMAMFSALWRNRPSTIGKERLLAVSNDPGRDDDREVKLVDVFVCKMRKKLAPLDITITTTRGEGYRIELPKQKAGAA